MVFLFGPFRVVEFRGYRYGESNRSAHQRIWLLCSR